jgi:hypothetical protein
MVCHGGPASIIDARRVGVKPIVVPRRRGLKEHVDDHQVLFARRLAETAYIELVETEDQLRTALDAAIADPGAYRIEAPERGTELDASIRRFEALAGALLGFDGSPRTSLPAGSTPRPAPTAVSTRRAH